jgi:hypothetical protein
MRMYWAKKVLEWTREPEVAHRRTLYLNNRYFLNGPFFWEFATLIDLMLLGHWIKMRSVMAASRALESVVRLLPATALCLLLDGGTEEVPVSDALMPGDRVLVRPGEKVPIVEGVPDEHSFPACAGAALRSEGVSTWPRGKMKSNRSDMTERRAMPDGAPLPLARRAVALHRRGHSGGAIDPGKVVGGRDRRR